MGRVSRRHQAKRRRWREAGVAERKLDTSFWLASGGDLEDDASWAGDDRGASDDDDAVDAFLLGANPDGAPDPDDDEEARTTRTRGPATAATGARTTTCGAPATTTTATPRARRTPTADSSDDAWAREWARRLSTDETSPRGASTDAGAEEARLAREMLGDDVVMADSGSDDDSDSSDDDSESSDSDASSADAPPAAYREPLVTTWDNKRKRKSGGYSPRGGIVRARADSKEELRRQRRAAKFAADAARPPPPPPKRTFAHPGGRITSNKEEANITRSRRSSPAQAEARRDPSCKFV